MRVFEPAARLRGIEKSMIRQIFDRAPAGSINLGLGEPDLPTPDVIRREAVRVIQEEQNGYTSHAGLPVLRERVASEYPHTLSSPDQVIITAGSQEALYLALMTIVDAGDEVLLPDPGFVAYATLVRMAGGVPVFYPLRAANDFDFDGQSFSELITPRTKAVIINTPSNPTGRALTVSNFLSIADALKGRRIHLISDEIYRDLYYTEERPQAIGFEHPHTIIIGGLSKSMSMTGWRLGWLGGEANFIRSALILHGYVTTCASTVSQKAALMNWTNEAAEARALIRRIFRERRDYLLELLTKRQGLRAVVPDGAFYTMVDVSAYGNSLEVAERMLAERVITVPGAAFGLQGEGYLRVSFCAEKETLSEGVRRMAQALT
ncbi:MAG TPA: aminotransferase class I/II-fold pyridoxal phosphate-dependent enzyme [Pyrinomonadaceae bacterium]|nr:aminotransferase class I/II-fold pyridoxal phosphate-dependent enzyme [Pyrinomonadaceae bacterium]